MISLPVLNEETYAALKAKHPAPHPGTCFPSPPVSADLSFQVTPHDVLATIRSFPNGSAGGPDRLLPQHLKDLVQDQDESLLLSALTEFCILVLQGDIPLEVRPVFFGASLVALQKESGGVRPIAVGCTLRRLCAKVASRMVRDEMADLLSPRQLGFGVPGGSEAAVHAARQYVKKMPTSHSVVKLDFANAFNSVRRDKMLQEVSCLCPDIYPFVFASYSSPSLLFWGDRRISSAEGVQQGDPLGPLLYCLSVHTHFQQLNSELCILYLDDTVVGGSSRSILDDLKIVRDAEELGLILNSSKSEIITRDLSTCAPVLSSLPGARVLDPCMCYSSWVTHW